tara:strand:+ start:7645 stop:8160 length:516 start_codon:yes stop_codon:yes gene_type:complete
MYNLIRLNPDERSVINLRRFLKENKEIISYPKENFHSTLSYTVETPIFQREGILQKIESRLPITLSPESYFFDIFGKDDLVLRFKSSKVLEIKSEIMQEAIRYTMLDLPNELSCRKIKILRKFLEQRANRIYFDFNPHITLAHSFDRSDLEKLTGFNEEIVFDSFDWNFKE